MFALLAGHLPFNDADNKNTAKWIIELPVKFEGKKWETISDDAKELIKSITNNHLNKQFKNRNA
jgi:hypothetical protein